MISVDGLTVEFGGTTLFSDISFQINLHSTDQYETTI